MFCIKTVIESVVEQGRRALLLATTRPRINPSGPIKRLKLSESHTPTGVGRPGPKGGNPIQHCEAEVHRSITLSSGGGIVNLLRPITSRIVQGLARRVSSPLWAEARKKSARRLFGETAPYFALVGVTLVSGPERGLLTSQDELEAICGDIREAISRAGWIHNPNFWKAPTPEPCHEENSATGKGFSLSDFDLGSAINKGCNAVVYATRLKNEDVKREPAKTDKYESVEAKIANNPPKLVDSLQDIFNNGSLWSLEQIQSNSGAISKNGSSSMHKEFLVSTDEDKTISPSTSKDSSTDTSSEDLCFNANYNAKAQSIASSTEDFLNLNQAYSVASLDDIGARSASTNLTGLGLRPKKSVSFSEDLGLLLSTGGYQSSRGRTAQKRKKKVKFQEEEYEREEEDERPHTPSHGGGTRQKTMNDPVPPSSLEEYPLAMKMMFNYEAESNAPAILAAMYKEMLPAKTTQLDEVSTLWKQRLLHTSSSLPPHANIVDMPCVFVDRVPHLADGLRLYPDALPRRINPAGYGRNMSLFCVMKRYDCTVSEYLLARTPGVRTSLLMLAQLLEAIHHVNKYGVAHRDLKSDNLLLCLKEGLSSPHLVLSDFGCCLPSSSFSVPFSSFEADPRAGNAALMAPEVKSCAPGLFSYVNYSRADLWAAGSLAYELFGLDNPFAPRPGGAGPRKGVLLDSVSYKESQLPRLPKTLPAEIRALVYDLLKRNPKQRPAPTVAATICQLSLWGPRKWLNRHALTMPSDNEVMRWLLCLSTKVLCEAGSSPSATRSPRPGSVGCDGEDSQGGELEYEIVSTFLKRVRYSDVVQAIKWIRAF